MKRKLRLLYTFLGSVCFHLASTGHAWAHDNELRLQGASYIWRIGGIDRGTTTSYTDALNSVVWNNVTQVENREIHIMCSGTTNGAIGMPAGQKWYFHGNTITVAHGDVAIFGKGVNDIGIYDLTIAGGSNMGIRMTGCSNVVLDNITITSGFIGIRVDSHVSRPWQFWVSNLTVTNCTFENLGSHGLETYGVDGIRVDKITARNLGECGVLFNGTINGTVGTVNAYRCSYGGGYAGLRFANTTHDIVADTLFARECGRGYFVLSGSYNCTLKYVEATDCIDNWGVGRGVWLNQVFGCRVEAGCSNTGYTATGGNLYVNLTNGCSEADKPVTYRLQNRQTGKYLDGLGRIATGSAIGQSNASAGESTQWIMDRFGPEQVMFRNRQTGYYIYAAGDTAWNGSDAAQGGGSASQMWNLIAADSQFISLKNVKTGFFLDGTDNQNGNVIMWNDPGRQSAQWKLVIVPPDTLPAPAQVNHYSFEDNTNDSLGNKHGTVYGAPLYQAGVVNRSMLFDGVDDYVKLPDGIGNHHRMTIAAWVKWNGGNDWQRIFDLGSNTTNYMFLTPGNGAVMRFAIRTPTVGEQVIDAPSLPVGEWKHVAVTIDGSLAKLYIDGVEAGRNPFMTLSPASLGNTVQNYLGRSQYPDALFKGQLDDFRFYNYPLSAYEVMNLKKLQPVGASVLKSNREITSIANVPFQYQIAATNDPTSFAVTNIPQGVVIDTASGIITGTLPLTGVYNLSLKIINAAGTGVDTIKVKVGSNIPVVTKVIAGGEKNTLEWAPLPGLTFVVKRSESPNGPFVTHDTVTTQVYVDTDVTAGSTWYYIISSLYNDIVLASSGVIAATAQSARVSWWKFDEPDGLTGADDWGNNPAALKPGVIHTEGKTGNGITLGSNDSAYAVLPAGIVSHLNDFTIASWVKMDAKANWMRLFDFGTGTAAYMFLSVQVGSNNIRYAIRDSGRSEFQVNYYYNLPLNTWTHIAITQSGRTASLFVNGIRVAVNNDLDLTPSALGPTTLNYLGRSQWADPLLRGTIDEFKIYNRALSETEVANTMKQQQTITFTALPEKVTGDARFSAGATASSALRVIYSSSNDAVASIVGDSIQINGAGKALITAHQPGNQQYAPALSIGRQLVVWAPPAIYTRQAQLMLDADGTAMATPALIDSGSVSYNGTLTLSLDRTVFSCTDVDQPVQVVLTGTDEKGLQGRDTVWITVADTISPVFTSVPAAQYFCFKGLHYTFPPVSVADNCSTPGVTYQITGATNRHGAGTDASGLFWPGVSLITWKATDTKGNQTTAAVTVQVQDIRCGNDNNKVLVCHNGQTLCVSVAAMFAHLLHGDKPGGCGCVPGSTVSARTIQPEEQQIAGMQSITIYPNPASTWFNIAGQTLTGSRYTLMTVTGSRISEGIVNGSRIQLPAGMAKGIYIIIITQKGQVLSRQRLVVQN